MAAGPGAGARRSVELTASCAAPPNEVFTYLTDHFFELWPGRAKVLEPGPDPSEPMGLGMVRWMKPPGSPALEERIITHERPRLIEYTVINDAPISNHLGRLVLTPSDTGTKVNYTIDFDYRPTFAGGAVETVLRSTWAVVGRRKLQGAFGG